MTLVLARSVESFSAGTVVEILNDKVSTLTVKAHGKVFEVSAKDLVTLRSRRDDVPARPRSKRRSDKVAVEGLINSMIERDKTGGTDG